MLLNRQLNNEKKGERGTMWDFSTCAGSVNQDQKSKRMMTQFPLIEFRCVSSGSCRNRFMEKCFILGCLEPVIFNPMEIDRLRAKRMICVNKFSFYFEGLLIV